jgi:hypothetical protein
VGPLGEGLDDGGAVRERDLGLQTAGGHEHAALGGREREVEVPESRQRDDLAPLERDHDVADGVLPVRGDRRGGTAVGTDVDGHGCALLFGVSGRAERARHRRASSDRRVAFDGDLRGGRRSRHPSPYRRSW